MTFSEIVWPWGVVVLLACSLILAMRRPSGPPPAPPAPPRALTAEETEKVRAHLRAGDKIAAIKEFRAMTGCGLKDAKDAVEAMDS